MHVRLILLLLLVCVAGPTHAETLLRLSETATMMTAPDEIFASMRAEASLPTPAAAQERVNRAMQEAVTAAKAAPGLTVSTGRYNVWRIGPTPQDRAERWQAAQSLELTGADPAILLRVVGDLQQQGLAVSNLGWRLSRQVAQRAYAEATRQALAALRGRIDAAADSLNLRFEQFKEVRLERSGAQLPMLRAMAAAPGAATPPPTAAPEDVATSATAEVDAILQPR